MESVVSGSHGIRSNVSSFFRAVFGAASLWPSLMYLGDIISSLILKFSLALVEIFHRLPDFLRSVADRAIWVGLSLCILLNNPQCWPCYASLPLICTDQSRLDFR